MLPILLTLAFASVTCAAPPEDHRPRGATVPVEPAEAPGAAPEEAGAGSQPSDERTFQPPRTLGEIFDGTIRDVAGTPTGPWIATGRNLRRLDPLTGEPVELHSASPLPDTITCIAAPPDGRLVVGTERGLYVHEPSGVTRVLAGERLLMIEDLEVLGDTGLVAFLSGLELVIVGPKGEDGLEVVGRTGETAKLLSLDRLSLLEHDGVWTAYIVGTPNSAERRGQRSLLVAELGADGKRPRFNSEAWEPAQYFRDPSASALAVRVFQVGARRIAYVACGTPGQLAKVDVTNGEKPRYLEQIVLHAGQPVANLAVDPGRGLLLVASANMLHVLDPETDEVLGTTRVGFYDGGDRDMGLCALEDGRRMLWTGTHHEVEHVLNGIYITEPRRARRVAGRWWISSSDGGVMVPEWNSVYLPTWGGIGRYDITDVSQPEPKGYHHAGHGATEHIEIVWPDPEDRDRALLVTAQGNGPVMLWPISRDAPDPGKPAMHDLLPREMVGNLIYQNDATTYLRDGELYVLSDIADRRTNRVSLRALHVGTGRWTHVTEENDGLRANAQAVMVQDDLAFVTLTGGFFVVRLDQLPERMEIVAEHVISLGRGLTRVTGLQMTSDMRSLFIGTDSPGRVLSYSYDPRSHRLSKPHHVIEDLPGVVGRLRLHERTGRLYCAARDGTVLEVDVSRPRRPRLLSSWKSGGYHGPMQDIHIVETPEGTRLLVSKNNEGFAILEPDAGL